MKTVMHSSPEINSFVIESSVNVSSEFFSKLLKINDNPIQLLIIYTLSVPINARILLSLRCHNFCISGDVNFYCLNTLLQAMHIIFYIIQL